MVRTTKGIRLEIIRVRSTKDSEGMVRAIIKTVKSDRAVESAGEVQVFSNTVGDIAVHISWQSDRTAPEGSTVAIQLAAALSEYGLINHTIWTEEV
jgi:hypothetical protein